MPPTRAAAEFVFGAYRTFQVSLTDIERRTQLTFGRLRDHDTLERTRAPYVELDRMAAIGPSGRRTTARP